MNREKRNLYNYFSEQEPPKQILEINVIAKSVNLKQIIGCLDGRFAGVNFYLRQF